MLGPILGHDLRVLFVGINPSLRSVEVNHHFARPGNRFWPALHAAGFTPYRLRPDEDGDLPRYGLGVTNLVARATRAADELSAEELRAGGRALEATLVRWSPRLVAIVGLTAYRTAFGRRKATIGLQPDVIGGRPVWVLPNPSGLNAHYKPADFARVFAEARAFAESLDAPGSRAASGSRAVSGSRAASGSRAVSGTRTASGSPALRPAPARPGGLGPARPARSAPDRPYPSGSAARSTRSQLP